MLLQFNLENVLNKVNNFINIDRYRQFYTAHFANLRKAVFENLRKNAVFSYIFNGFQLGGSYGDNVKVTLPNEFDLILHIRFPEQSLINVLKDDELPGNVLLDFTNVIQKIKTEEQHEENLKHLRQWLDEQNFLQIEKFQLFMQSCFTRVLSDMENKIKFKEELYNLSYRRNGPAHTIYVDSLNFKYSVDFVPGILLGAKQCVIPHLNCNWEAVPKLNGTNNQCTSFIASYYQEEHNLIHNKKQLKNVYRMLKKFRDNKTNMLKMKSYFIKTLFLFKASRENSTYWRQPLAKIIIDMFQDFENSLHEGILPYFWDKNLNLYKHYSRRLLREMLRCVEKTRGTLQKAAILLTISLQHRVYCIFLNKHERNLLETPDKTIINFYSERKLRRKSPMKITMICRRYIYGILYGNLSIKPFINQRYFL